MIRCVKIWRKTRIVHNQIKISDVVELIADNYSINNNVKFMEAQDASPVSLETSLQQSSIDTQGTGTPVTQDNGLYSHLDLRAPSFFCSQE